MSENKHTPGPWTPSFEYDGRIRSASGQTILKGSIMSTTEMDLYLAAASPDLLEACELALRILDRDGLQEIRGEAWTDTERERLELAVKKAKGE